jgi:uncharacterized membrane protein YhaH (DUF805 family)
MSVTVHNEQTIRTTAWIKKLMSFAGTATRSAMIGVVCMLLVCITITRSHGTLWWLPSQLFVAVSFMWLLWIFAATSVRRLHDLGRSGHWFWLLLMPAVSQCATILLCCLPTKKVDNATGLDSRPSNEATLPRWQRVVLCVIFVWVLLAFVTAGADHSSTAQDRCLELLVIGALPLYVLWLPWWLWITIRDRRSTEPSRFWLRRLLIAVSTTWLLVVLCITLSAELDSLSEAVIMLLLFGIAPIAVVWMAYGLLRKLLTSRRAA